MLYVKTPRVVLWLPVNHRLYLVQISARFLQVAVCFRTGHVVFWNETRKTVSEREPQNSPMIKSRSVWSYWEEVDDREKMSSWKLRKNIRWYNMIHVHECMCVCECEARAAMPVQKNCLCCGLTPNSYTNIYFCSICRCLRHIHLNCGVLFQRLKPESITNCRKTKASSKMK